MKNRKLLCLMLAAILMLLAMPAMAAGTSSVVMPERGLEMTLSASVVTNVNSTLQITLTNKSVRTTYSFGSTFSIEMAKDGKWVNMSGYGGYYPSWGYSVAPGKSVTLNLSLADQGLVSGTYYRLCKSVYDERCKVSEMVYAEFCYNETSSSLNGWTTNGNTIATRPGTSYDYTAASYRYATEPVNVRTGPGTKYKKIGELATGEQVRLIGTSGKWSEVVYRGQVAYVFTKYLTAYAPTGSASAGSSNLPATTVRYVTTNLNLRSGPGTKYSVLATIRKGGAVTCLSTSGNWTKVTCAGYTGYVFTKYLSDTAPAGATYSGSYYLEGYGWINNPYYMDNSSMPSGYIPGYGLYIAGKDSASSGSGFKWNN